VVSHRWSRSCSYETAAAFAYAMSFESIRDEVPDVGRHTEETRLHISAPEENIGFIGVAIQNSADHKTFSHELGHILRGFGHVTTDPNALMAPGGVVRSSPPMRSLRCARAPSHLQDTRVSRRTYESARTEDSRCGLASRERTPTTARCHRRCAKPRTGAQAEARAFTS
jgi:hypothetical protein